MGRTAFTVTLSQLEAKRCEKIVAAFVERRRPPRHLRSQVDLAFRLPDQRPEVASLEEFIAVVSEETAASSADRLVAADIQRLPRPDLGPYTARVSLLEPLFEALNRADVRYVVVGGVATVLHGFARLTADVDLVVDLAPIEARKAIETLVGLGLRPRPPVDPSAFADSAVRESWIRDKGMRVFSMWDPTQPMREVDLFVEHPIDFEGLFVRAEIVSLDATTVRVASIPDLIALKRLASRPQDLADIEALEAILQTRKPTDG